MKRPSRTHCLAVLSLMCSLPITAATVYKSVDESGVVTFSDTLPTQNVTVETVEIVEQATVSGAQTERLEDMRETTDRMAADRMAREKHRAEIRKLQAETNAQKRPEEYANNYPYSSGYTNYSGYYRYPVRRPNRHPNRPRPEHPIVRPPLLPPAGNFPAPHIRPLVTHRVRGGF
jgi:hypothetical protein